MTSCPTGSQSSCLLLSILVLCSQDAAQHIRVLPMLQVASPPSTSEPLIQENTGQRVFPFMF